MDFPFAMTKNIVLSLHSSLPRIQTGIRVSVLSLHDKTINNRDNQ